MSHDRDGKVLKMTLISELISARARCDRARSLIQSKRFYQSQDPWPAFSHALASWSEPHVRMCAKPILGCCQSGTNNRLTSWRCQERFHMDFWWLLAAYCEIDCALRRNWKCGSPGRDFVRIQRPSEALLRREKTVPRPNGGRKIDAK